MPDLRGTQTLLNLCNAFAGESQARNRYSFFAKQARLEGYEQIGWVFDDTAANEHEHATNFYNHIIQYLDATDVIVLPVNAEYPFGLGTTLQNLRNAAFGEHDEWYNLYPAFAKAAADEGFADVANRFTEVSEAEKGHEERYLKLINNIEQGIVFKRGAIVRWRCRECGYIHEGYEPPLECPSCGHPRAFYELLIENY
jgi:rubrerythrin